MNKSELIKKLEEKHSSILLDYNKVYRNGRNTFASSECRSRMKDVLDIIKELKNLSGETVKPVNEHGCNTCEIYISKKTSKCSQCVNHSLHSAHE